MGSLGYSPSRRDRVPIVYFKISILHPWSEISAKLWKLALVVCFTFSVVNPAASLQLVSLCSFLNGADPCFFDRTDPRELGTGLLKISEAMASKSRSWSSISFLIVPDFPLWFSLLSFLLHSDFNFSGLAHHLALPIVDNYKNQFGALHKPHDRRNETKNDRQKHSS